MQRERPELNASLMTVFIKRTEKNLRALVKMITDFSKISGLKANLDKTMVCPLGGNFSTAVEDQLCPD